MCIFCVITLYALHFFLNHMDVIVSQFFLSLSFGPFAQLALIFMLFFWDYCCYCLSYRKPLYVTSKSVTEVELFCCVEDNHNQSSMVLFELLYLSSVFVESNIHTFDFWS